MKSKHGTAHITPADGNVFLDLGFEPEEADALKVESDRQIRESLARMQAAPRFFSQGEWNALASYEGQVVSGDPEGRVPDNLEADDNE